MDEICDLMIKKYPDLVDIVYGTEEPDESSLDSPSATVTVVQLFDAVDQLLDRLKNDKELKPYRYVFDCPRMMIKGSDNFSGLRLGENNAIFRILCGINKCVLVEKIPDAEGKLAKYGEEIDIRDQTSIHCNDLGEIIIRKTKSQSPIVKDLKKLKLFLEKFDGGKTVLKIMA